MLFRAVVDGKFGLFTIDDDGAEPADDRPGDGPARGRQQLRQRRVLRRWRAGSTTSTADADGCCQLWVMDADGTNQREFLPRGPAWDGMAAVSPDGKLVAYWHNPNDGEPHGISVVRADGSGQPIETGPMLSGTAHWMWSPDSTKILMFPNDIDTGSAYLLDPAGGPWTTVQWGSIGDLDWQRLALVPWAAIPAADGPRPGHSMSRASWRQSLVARRDSPRPSEPIRRRRLPAGRSRRSRR